MNKEIKYVDEDTVLVFDEYGNYTKKPYEINMEKKLETENKIENIKNVIKKTKEEILECENLDDVLNFLLKLMLVLPIVSMPLVYVNVITPIVGGLIVYCASAGALTSVFFKKNNKKIKKGLNAKLEYVNSIESEYYDELEKILSNSTLSNEISKNYNFVDEIVPIKYYDGLDSNVKENMNIVYNEAYSNSKSLILKKNKKHK